MTDHPTLMPCREWQGCLNEFGYGLRNNKRFKTKLVHRQIMEIAGHDITGKVVMHLCDNPACFRYDHLRVATQADNLRDMAAKRRHKDGRKTHCKHGHQFTEANTYIRKNGGRTCRECERLRGRREQRWRKQ